MTVDAINGSDNRVRNAAIGLGAGLVAGGAGGYFTKSLLKDDDYSDSFVKKMHDVDADDAGKTAYKNAESIAELGGKDKTTFTVDEMKNAIKKHGEAFKDTDGKAITLAEGADEDAVKAAFDKLKTAAAHTDEDGFGAKLKGLKDGVKDKLDTVYDKAGKKFKDLGEGAAEETKTFAGKVKSAIRNMKLKQAAIYGGIAAAVAAIIGYVATPKAKAAEELPAEQATTEAAK